MITTILRIEMRYSMSLKRRGKERRSRKKRTATIIGSSEALKRDPQCQSTVITITTIIIMSKWMS